MQSCKIYSLEVADPNELCSQIIHATEAGIDLGDLLDSCLLTLSIPHMRVTDRHLKIVLHSGTWKTMV